MAKAETAVEPSMLDRLQQEAAEGWNPNEGDTLVGTVLSIKASQPNEYGIYPIVTLQSEDGKSVAVHCFHQTLKERLLEKRPAPGEKIAIQYVGTKESKQRTDPSGKPVTYHNYAVVVDRPTDTEAQAAWDTFGGVTEPELPVE
jgi:hypothetical protein